MGRGAKRNEPRNDRDDDGGSNDDDEQPRYILMCKLVTQTPEILRFLRGPGLLMRAKICPHLMYSRCHDAWG